MEGLINQVNETETNEVKQMLKSESAASRVITPIHGR